VFNLFISVVWRKLLSSILCPLAVGLLLLYWVSCYGELLVWLYLYFLLHEACSLYVCCSLFISSQCVHNILDNGEFCVGMSEV
jgi:hypothetical protein